MDLRAALKLGISQLCDAGTPSFTLAAELLLLHTIGRDRTWLYSHPEEIISDADAQKYYALLARRTAGEPTQYLTGKQEFWGLDFEVNPAVLIPRPETEHVIEVALDRLALREIKAGRPQLTDGEGLQIADVGTGSGCIAIALAKGLSLAKIYATDISPAALEVACRNAARHEVADRVHFIESNLLDQVSSPQTSVANVPSVQNPKLPESSTPFFHLIVSNPPYIGRKEAPTLQREVRDHEPESALYGGEEGYEFYGDLVTQALRHLQPGGLLVLELGHNSLPAVEPLLDSGHWTSVGTTNDLAGIPRVIAAEKL